MPSVVEASFGIAVRFRSIVTEYYIKNEGKNLSVKTMKHIHFDKELAEIRDLLSGSQPKDQTELVPTNPYQSLDNLPDNIMEWIQDDSDEYGQAYEFSDLDGERMYFADDDLHQVMKHVAWNAHLRASLNAIYF
jgi:hypothetical protein